MPPVWDRVVIFDGCPDRVMRVLVDTTGGVDAVVAARDALSDGERLGPNTATTPLLLTVPAPRVNVEPTPPGRSSRTQPRPPADANQLRFVHNVIWDADAFEQMLAELAGQPRNQLDPETFRCSTIDGTPIAPTDAILNALVNEFRRVVVDTHSLVIDLGAARGFTGLAGLAAQLQSTHCPWAGCLVPTSRCEIDHLQPHCGGGSTNPADGAPLCGRHNRWKQQGSRVRRDPTGTWHTLRPDGTEI